MKIEIIFTKKSWMKSVKRISWIWDLMFGWILLEVTAAQERSDHGLKPEMATLARSDDMETRLGNHLARLSLHQGLPKPYIVDTIVSDFEYQYMPPEVNSHNDKISVCNQEIGGLIGHNRTVTYSSQFLAVM